jgi:hypothetical protein
MSGRKAIVGLCMACALVFSAVAAQGAQAAGTTAFTCIHSGTGTLWGEHCLASNPGHGETSGWEHVAIANTEETHAKLTNEKTTVGTAGAEPARLRTVVGGVAVELESTVVASLTGATLQNGEEGGEMFSHGTGQITFSNVTVVEPAHCAVEGITAPGGPGMVTTTPLTATTKGQGMNLKFSPVTAPAFTEFKLVNNGGTCAAANPAVKIDGTVLGQPDATGGATTTFNEEAITGTKELRFGSPTGPAAGLEGKITISAGKKPETEPTHPISATTQ